MEEPAGLFAFHVSGSFFFGNAQLDELTISLMFRIYSLCRFIPCAYHLAAFNDVPCLCICFFTRGDRVRCLVALLWIPLIGADPGYAI